MTIIIIIVIIIIIIIIVIIIMIIIINTVLYKLVPGAIFAVLIYEIKLKESRNTRN